jgi:hypothetical protein
MGGTQTQQSDLISLLTKIKGRGNKQTDWRNQISLLLHLQNIKSELNVRTDRTSTYRPIVRGVW